MRGRLLKDTPSLGCRDLDEWARGEYDLSTCARQGIASTRSRRGTPATNERRRFRGGINAGIAAHGQPGEGGIQEGTLFLAGRGIERNSDG